MSIFKKSPDRKPTFFEIDLEAGTVKVADKETCLICGVDLPVQRDYRGLCNPCGWTFHTETEQLDDCIRLSAEAKTPQVGFDRAMLGIALIAQLKRYLDKGVPLPKDRSYHDLLKYFTERLGYWRRQILKTINGSTPKRLGCLTIHTGRRFTPSEPGNAILLMWPVLPAKLVGKKAN